LLNCQSNGLSPSIAETPCLYNLESICSGINA